MKHNPFFIFTLLLYCTFSSCAAEKPDNIKLGIISDIHYLSEQLMDGGQAIEDYDNMSGKVVSEIPAILDQVLNDYLNSDIEVLLISGDMTKDGEKQSHIDLVKKLKPLIEKGIRIYVIPGNHDVNMPRALGYKANASYKVPNTSPKEFTEIYVDCGYGDAIKRDANSLSYVAELNSSTWLLAIDSNKYDEYTATNATSGGRVKPETEKWIVEVMNEAKQNDIQVIGMIHHGIVEHIMMQATFFSEYIVDDWERIAALFADLGLKIMFTGHFHANDITEFSSKQGNKIYDVETGSLAAYPFPYRFAELNKTSINISTKNITSTPENPNLMQQNKLEMQERAKRIAIEKMNQRGFQFPAKTTALITDIVAKVFVMHLAGDEKPDEELKEWVRQLAVELDSPMDVSNELLGLDMYPADNNVEIIF